MPPKTPKKQRITRYFPTTFQSLRQAMANLPEEMEGEIAQFANYQPLNADEFYELYQQFVDIDPPLPVYIGLDYNVYNEYLNNFNTSPVEQIRNLRDHALRFLERKYPPQTSPLKQTKLEF